MTSLLNEIFEWFSETNSISFFSPHEIRKTEKRITLIYRLLIKKIDCKVKTKKPLIQGAF
jgi:hypothetical protein